MSEKYSAQINEFMEKVKVLNDVYFNPILLNDLATLVVRLIKSKKFGVYNICSNVRE